jgi:hypothetical protein
MESCAAAGSEVDSVEIACERDSLLEMDAASCIEIDSSEETWADGLVVLSQGHLKAVILDVGAQYRRQNPWRKKNRASRLCHRIVIARLYYTYMMIEEPAFIR